MNARIWVFRAGIACLVIGVLMFVVESIRYEPTVSVDDLHDQDIMPAFTELAIFGMQLGAAGILLIAAAGVHFGLEYIGVQPRDQY
ncbi:hypothetical protein [Planctomicrobium piriforme]|uniref:Uncharacterized protein n=1 Tax=Planctomicrobium piriforme TaxID=1576369 RepID=A0A1I3M0L2_9PLAN|nr:hypothetical protein [Planctomicrobium piriforme]SFI90330.1 hypothetical protein SAMN05421753_113119 [Planctomicrobium piriforme]